MTNYWAVIPSCCRETELRELTSRLLEDDVSVVIIDTGLPFPFGSEMMTYPGVHLICDGYAPKNISRWWNTGLRYVSEQEMGNAGDYVVAVLNDDVVVPRDFVKSLGFALEDGVAVAVPDVYNVGYRRVTSLNDGPRMPGFAFAMRGDNLIFADETLQWWYGDNDIDWQARGRGGVVFVPGVNIQHIYPNSTTVGELAEQAGRDRETFVAKWGRAPW